MSAWLERVDWSDPLSYIRERYGVTAEIGRRVTIWTGERGLIVGGDGARLLVQVADALHDFPVILLHPTWEIQYGDEVVATTSALPQEVAPSSASTRSRGAAPSSGEEAQA